MKLQVTYDKEADAFALSRERVSHEHADLWEVYPWVMLEVGEETGELLCVEILGAANTLGTLLESLNTEEEFVCVDIEGELFPIKDALLEVDCQAGDGYKEYMMFGTCEETARQARLNKVRDALAPYLLSIHTDEPAQAQPVLFTADD